MAQASTVTVDDPDGGPNDPPAYEGTVADMGRRLAPGRYRTTTEDGDTLHVLVDPDGSAHVVPAGEQQ